MEGDDDGAQRDDGAPVAGGASGKFGTCRQKRGPLPKIARVHNQGSRQLQGACRGGRGGLAMAGQRQKPVELLQFRRGGRGKPLVVYDDGDRRVPPLPRGCRHVGPAARQAWRELWSSPVRAAIDPRADGGALRDYVLLVDEQDRLRAQMAAGEMTAPTVARMAQVERQLQKLREHLALTPLARFRLQLQVLSGREREQRLAAQSEQAKPPAVVVLDDPAPEPWRPHRDQLGSQP